MRRIGHDVDVDRMREDYDYYRNELKESTAARASERRERNPDHFTTHVETAFMVARIGYLLDAPFKEVVETLGKNLRELVAAMDLGATLSPIDMREYLGAALTVGDKPLIKWLAELPKDAYAEPGIEVSEAGYLLVQAVQAGMKGDDKAFRSRVKKFRAALEPARLVADPKSEQAIYEPLASLLESIAAADQEAFGNAWTQQAKGWKKRFGRASEKANMDGILDLEALGLARLAQKAGLDIPDTNPYAPSTVLAAGKAL